MTINSVVFRLALATCALAFSTQVSAQAHMRRAGVYTVRSSTVDTETLSEESARKHGIERSPRRAIINVTVMKKEGRADVTVPADVAVKARDLTGHERSVEMKKTANGGWTSYMGTYDFVNGEVIDFTVTAKPENSENELILNYRDRMWVPQKPAR